MKDPLTTYTAEGIIDSEFLEQLAYNEKMAELGRLSAGMMHEINTPLSVVISATQLILREEGLTDFVREMVERINLEVQRLSLYTKGVLSFAREDEKEGGETDVNVTLQEVLAFLRYEARKNSIKVVEDIDFRLSPISMDPNRLKQILINLIVNALQAMSDGGTLLVKTCATPDNYVEIQIADTGPGIPPAIIDRVFEPYFTTKEAGEGTGLGLYITKKLTEHFSGSIRVQSSMGEGTTFYLRFPSL